MPTTREIQNGCPNQASGYEMANKPKIKKKERMVKKKGKRETTTLSEKKEEASNLSK